MRKGFLGSGVEYCGTCLNGVREVIGGYWPEGVRVLRGGGIAVRSTWQEGVRGVRVVRSTWQEGIRGVMGVTVVPCYMGLAGSGVGGGGVIWYLARGG